MQQQLTSLYCYVWDNVKGINAHFFGKFSTSIISRDHMGVKTSFLLIQLVSELFQSSPESLSQCPSQKEYLKLCDCETFLYHLTLSEWKFQNASHKNYFQIISNRLWISISNGSIWINTGFGFWNSVIFFIKFWHFTSATCIHEYGWCLIGLCAVKELR